MAQFRKDTHEYLANGKTIFEAVMLADQYGNLVGAANPTGVAVDAFNRARVSTPFTLFDNANRFDENNWQFATSNTAGANTEFDQTEGAIKLKINTTASGAEIVRESKRVFAYQPGKSLLVLNSFNFEEAKTGLRQRIGYFGANNGVYFEQSNNDVYFVKRQLTPSGVQETRIAKEDWNIDPLDGTGPSKITLDLTKSQLLWTDIEWLGVGTVRQGFIMNGQFIHCHSHHHANLGTSTYMQTACLPVRFEIKNIGTTSSNSVLTKICTSVISEGGYDLRGEKRSISIPINAPRECANAAFYYPIISLRLKPEQLDAIVIPKGLGLSGVGNNAYFNWRLIRAGTTNGGSWVSAGTNSSVEYNITGTSVTDGRVLNSGYFSSTTQSSSEISALGDQSIFGLQLRRDGLNDTPEEFILAVASKVAGDDVYASLTWEEMTR